MIGKKGLLFIFSIFLTNFVFSQQLSIVTFTPDTYGNGGSIAVPVSLQGCFALDNQFQIFLSDASGSFNNPMQIGSYNGFYTEYINGVIPASTVAGNKYKVRIQSTNPMLTVESGAFSIVGSNLPVVSNPAASGSNTINDSSYGRCLITSNQLLTLQETVPTGYTLIGMVRDSAENSVSVSVSATQIAFTMVPGNYYTLTVKLKNNNDNSISSKSFLVLATSNNLSLQTSGATDVCLPDTKTYTINITGNGGIKNNYPGTKYSIEWGDGVVNTFTHCELVTRDGALSHDYNRTSCGQPPIADLNPVQYNAFRVNVKASNVFCPNSFTSITTYSKVWQKPIADFINPGYGCLNTPITFPNISQAGLSGYNNVVNCIDVAAYEWYVDGMLIFNAPKNLVYTFTTTGYHTVKLIAVNDPCSNEITKQICIEEPLNPNFKINGTDSVTGCAPLTVNIQNLTTFGSGYQCRPVKLSWQVLLRPSLQPGIIGVDYDIQPSDSAVNPIFTFLKPGQYFIRLSVSNACGSNYKDLPVTITDIAGVSFNFANKRYCGTKTIDFATDANHRPTYNSNSGIESYIWTITGGSYSYAAGSTSTSAYPQIKFNDYAAYTVSLRFTNSCGTKTAAQSITFDGAVTATAINDTSLCNNTTLIQLNASSSGVSSSSLWSIVSGTGSISNPAIPNPTYTFSNADRTNGSVTARYTVNPIAGSVCATATADVVITLDPVNIITSSSAKTICTATGVNYSPIAAAGSNFSWTSTIISGNVTGNSVSGTGNINDSLTNTSITADAVVKYTITPLKNGCNGQIFTLLVTVVPTPDLQVTPAIDTICTGTATNFILGSSYTAAYYKWTAVLSAGSITGFSSQAIGILTNKIAQTLINTGNTLATVTYTITATSSNGTCDGETKTVKVIIRPGATVANAGSDQLLCNQLSTILSANNPIIGSGVWKQISGPSSTIVNATAYNTAINNLLADSSYKYLWTITASGQCPSTSDTVIIINRSSTTISNAGADIVVCDFIANGTVKLNANADTSRIYEKHLWTLLLKPANANTSFSDTANTKAIFSFDQPGNYQLLWTISNDANCPPTKDTVEINVFNKAIAGTLTGKTNICLGSDVVFSLSNYSGNIKKWQYNPDPINDNSWKDTVATTSTITFLNVMHSFAVRAIVESINTPFNCYSTDTSNVLTISTNPSARPGTTPPADTVCKNINGGTITLTGNTAKILNWEYQNINDSLWVTIQDTTSSFIYSNLSATTRFRAIIESGSCGTIASSVSTITVVEPVTQAFAGADQLICTTSALLQGNVPAKGELAKWRQLSGPSNALIDVDTASAVTASSFIAGTYQFIYTLSNGKCAPTTDTVSVFVRSAITPANAGKDITVCDFISNGRIDLKANADTSRPFDIHQWSIVNQPINGKGTFSDSSNPVSAFTFNSTGAFHLLWTITNDAGCPPTKDTVAINVYEKPVVGKIAANAFYCGTSDVVVTLANYTGQVKKWQYNPAPIQDNVWKDTLITTPTITFASAADTFAVRVIVEAKNANNVCTSTDTSNTLLINITPATVPGTTGPADTVCFKNNAGTIKLTGYVGRVLRWEFSEGNSWMVINDTTSAIKFNNLLSTTTYRAIVQNGNCVIMPSAPTVITVLGEVTKAIAGIDQLICSTSTQLESNRPNGTETGKWIQISGPNTAKLSDSTKSLVTTYDLIQGTYYFSWNISNGVCAPSADTVVVTVRPVITLADAGNDILICDFVAGSFVRLNAINPNPSRAFETKIWKIVNQPVNGNATLSDPTDLHAILNYNAAGIYQLEWSITNDAGCMPTKDTLTITVVQKPVAGRLTANTVVCYGGDVLVAMGSYTGVIKKWQYNIAPLNDNIWIDSIITSSSINFLNVGDTFSVRAIVESKGAASGCSSVDTSNTVIVNVIPGVIAGTTGPAATVCKESNGGDILLKGSSGKIIRWEYSEDSGFTWQTVNNTSTTYNYSNLNITTSFRAVVENGNCGSKASSPTTITVMDIVTPANAGTDQVLCAANTATLNGNKPATTETVIWTQIKGNRVVFSSNTISNPTVSDLQPGNYSFVYTITNNICPATTDTVNISIYSALVNTIDTTSKTICSGEAVTIKGQNATGGNGRYSYQWQSSTDGNNWTNLTGEFNPNLTVIVTGNIYLRRIINSLPCTAVSAPLFITVTAAISNNIISSNQNICINTPAALLNGSMPTGQTGTYSFEWKQSIDTGKTWVLIPNSNSQNYNPGVIKFTTSYRRNINSVLCNGLQSSNVVTVIINPDTKASFNYTKNINCPPFIIDSSIIKTDKQSGATATYQWFANNKLIGTGIYFPGYTITNSNDSVMIRLVTLSNTGCKDDTARHWFYSKLAASPPVISVNTAVGCGPLTVAFTNLTANKGSFTYKWNFGNGITSTAVDPGNIIFRANPDYGDTIYKVSLTVFSTCDSITVYQDVKVRSAAQALFKPDRTVGCSPMTVTFTNYSQGANDFIWNFGDGSIINTTKAGIISHTFTSYVQDTFRVSLIARSECGSDTQYYSIVVSPLNIRLLLTVNGDQKSGCSPHTVQLINNSKGASSFRWDFGDGNFMTTTRNIDTVTHQYNLPGHYIIKLLASNSCSDTATTDSVVVFAKPVVDFSLMPSTVCLGDTIHFTNLSSTVTGLQWNFGDGTTSTLINPAHKYSAAGIYNVTLIGIRQYAAGVACIDSAHKIATIVSSLPGSFTMSDSIGYCSPFTVTFTNNNLPSILTAWNFGDGTKDSGDVVKHTFISNGNFTVTMTAMDPGGCTYKDNKKVVVKGPSGSFVYDKAVKCDNSPVRFKATILDVDSLRWDFGDGVVLTSTNDLVYHTYSKPGNYIPSVTLFAGTSCSQLLTGPDTIRVDFIKAGFSQISVADCGSTNVSFRDTSRAFSSIQTFAWKFGDASTAFTPNPTHSYKTTNTWLVQLIAISKYGCIDTARKLLPVTINTPPIAAIISDSVACSNSRIAYSSSVVSTDTILSYRWSFTNGYNFNGISASNMYFNAGKYKATLIVSTINGCVDTAFKNITINPAPGILATADQTVCPGQSVQLSVSGGSGYIWGPFNNISCINCSNPIVTPVNTTSYTVKGFNSYGCSATDTVTINIPQPFKIKPSLNDTLCIGKASQLFASGADKYKWTPSYGLNKTEIANPLANPAQTTRYRVIGTDNSNCFSDTAYVTVAVGNYPSVNLGPDKVLSAGSLLPITPVITNGPITKWEWLPAHDLSCSNCGTPTASIKKDITYAVIATNAYGCKATDSINIKVFCESTQVYIPNVFTPDGDGVNDILMVRGTGINTVKSFRIFNRWGEIVFEKANFYPNEKSSGWDGTVRGSKAPTDIYVYTCEVVCENGNSFVYKGNVAIIK